jgi:hypothetical protein
VGHRRWPAEAADQPRLHPLGAPPPTPSLAPADATARGNRNCSTVEPVVRDIQRSSNPAERAARTGIGYRDGWVEATVTLFQHADDYQEDWAAPRRLYGLHPSATGLYSAEGWVELSRLCALADDVRVANVTRIPRIPRKESRPEPHGGRAGRAARPVVDHPGATTAAGSACPLLTRLGHYPADVAASARPDRLLYSSLAGHGRIAGGGRRACPTLLTR